MSAEENEDISSEGIVGCLPTLLDPVHRSIIEKLVEELPELVEASSSDPRPLEISTDRYTRLLNLYREQPNLLDCAISGILQKLLTFITLPTSQNGVIDELTNQALLYISCLNGVRGYKVLTRMLPHEVGYLEKLLTTLEIYGKGGGSEQKNVLLLWLWIVIRNPFDLRKFDANETGRTMNRIFSIAMPYIDSIHSSIMHSAALVIAQCLSRADGVAQIPSVIDDQLEKIQKGDPLSSLIILLAIFKHVDRIHLETHVEKIAEVVTTLLPLDSSKGVLLCKSTIKLVQRIAMTVLQPKVASWRYRRGRRKLDDMLSGATNELGQEKMEDMEEEEFEVHPVVEWSLGHVLEALSDVDTELRWSAAKGIGRITSRLPKSYSDQVVETIIGSYFDEHAGYASHHGGCMALAELARRGFLLPHFLPQAFPVVQKSLFYEEPTRHQFGNQVRDAACYVLWAFARAYEPDEISKYIESIATGLICVALFDREVNLRRAASAAFQENVGRQKNFPNGIALLTIADYFSVGNRQRCYAEVCAEVAKFEVYKKPIIEHLVNFKVVHWDERVREQAAIALETLSPFVIEMGLVEELLTVLVRGATSQNVLHRHGYIIALGHLLKGLVHHGHQSIDGKFLDAIGYLPIQLAKECDRLSTAGAIPTRKAICALMRLYTQARLPLSEHLTDEWMKRIFVFLRTDLQIQQNAIVRQLAASAAREVIDQYVLHDFEKYEEICTTHIVKSATENERIGLCMLAESFPPTKVSSKLFEGLCGVITRRSPNDKRWSLGRQAAVKALQKLILDSPISQENNFDALFIALNEYTVADKGEVGRFVRQAAMEALSELMTSPKASKLLLETYVRRLVRNLVRQSAEKIGRTRECACQAMQNLLQSERTRKFIDFPDVLDEIYKDSHAFLLDRHILILTPLFDYDEYFEDVVRGLIISSGGISEGNEKFGKMTLLDYQKRIAMDKEKLTKFLTTVNTFFQENMKTSTIITSVLTVLPQVFLHLDCFRRNVDESKEVMSMTTSIKKLTAHPKCSPSMLRLCLDALCAVLAVNQGVSVNQMASSVVIKSLSSPIPTIRKLAAERLYENLCCAEVDEEVLQLLCETNWQDTDSVDVIFEAAEMVEKMLT